MNSKSTLAATALLALNACAGSTFNYQPPAVSAPITERSVSGSFETNWDLYVAELSKSFFVINNISKESRIINVSFSTQSSGEYVDCGRTSRTSTHPATGEEFFEYDVADDSRYNAGRDGTNELFTIDRSTSLEGRVNVYIAPEINNTLIRVNSKYIWKGQSSGRSNIGTVVTPGTTIVDFSTAASGTNQEVTCSTKGILEDRLLKLI